ncbi:MarR family winged helix-turn-helix transcriptional regulator [Vallitalea okinawensis]|uniref:MarR family winged helix-turn-helix transcriptional regulator n=1 Tax=Vallitalea okinawensis TaxID=2078660 RepID=UPI000CFE0A06|nr:MarR family transcriptional regulator [Vallitalea okinawensis]
MSSKRDDMLLLENQFCFQVYAASRLVTKAYRPLLNKLDLTYPQYLVMLLLWEHGVISVKELGKLLYLDSGTLTPLLKRLEKLGVLHRSRSKEDERILMVTLTEQGRELKEKTKEMDIPKQLMEGLNLSCTAEELGHLREDLKKLIKDINSLNS